MSNSQKDLDLEFKKAELKRKQLENRKFEAEVKSLELDVELKAQVQEFNGLGGVLYRGGNLVG